MHWNFIVYPYTMTIKWIIHLAFGTISSYFNSFYLGQTFSKKILSQASQQRAAHCSWKNWCNWELSQDCKFLTHTIFLVEWSQDFMMTTPITGLDIKPILPQPWKHTWGHLGPLLTAQKYGMVPLMPYHNNSYYLKAVQDPVQLQTVVYIFVCCFCFAAVVLPCRESFTVRKKTCFTVVQTLSY